MSVPEALTNDNWWGYVTKVLYQYKVRWIEAAAACPIFTALICYYVEGDRGHLMNVQQHGPERGSAVRGNVYSFHMPLTHAPAMMCDVFVHLRWAQRRGEALL